MQLVDKSYCDRCGKHTEIVRLIPKDGRGDPSLYTVLCRECLDNEWVEIPPRELNEVKKG